MSEQTTAETSGNAAPTPYEAAMAWRKQMGIDSPGVEVDPVDGTEMVTVGNAGHPVSLRIRRVDAGGLLIRSEVIDTGFWVSRAELAAVLPAFINAVAYGTLAAPSAYQPDEFPGVQVKPLGDDLAGLARVTDGGGA